MQSLHRVSASYLQRFLETPEELLRESEEMQMAIASFPDTPRSLLSILVNSDYSAVVEAARLHVNFADEITGDCQDVSEVLRNLDLGQNDRLAVELMQFAPVAPCFLSEWVPERRLIEGLQNEYMPLRYRLQLLERLSQSDKLEARLVVAESLETPVSLLELLAGDLELAVRLTVESNDNFPSEVVELVKSQHDLANDWDADVEQLRELGESRWSWIRLTVAQNPFAAEDVLMKLTTDEFSKIRFAVAKNPNSSAEVLGVLAEESLRLMQETVVKHPNVSEETLHRLFDGYKSEIQKRKDLPRSILERFYREKKYKNVYLFFSNDNTPIWILAELANVDIEALTAKAISRKDSSPIIETFEHFFEGETRFLTEIAKHPQVSVDILEHLTQYSSSDLKLAIAENPKAPEELRISLLQQLCLNSKANTRIKIASNPQTSIVILEQLANASYKLDGAVELLRQLAPDITSNLLKRIKTFIYKCQSPEMVIWDLGQISTHSVLEALEEWNNLVKSFNKSEIQTLEYLANQESPLEWEGRYTARKRSNRRRQASFSDDELAENYHTLNGLMHLLNTQYNCDCLDQEVVAALLENPSLPVNLREKLWERYKKTPNDESEYLEDWDMRMALAFNPQTSEEERIEYLQQLLSYEITHIGSYVGYKIHERIARNPLTPISILEFILKNRRGAIRHILENPNAPISLIKEFTKEGNYYNVESILRNRNTSKQLFQELALKYKSKTNRYTLDIKELAQQNYNLNSLDVYKVELELEAKEKVSKSYKLIAQRTNNYDILERIVETAQQEAKVIIARKDETPIPILERLAKDSDEEVCEAVVRNQNCPSNCLRELAQNSTDNIQYLIASRNYPTPRDVLLKLLESENKSIFSGMAGNIHTPPDILASLAENEQRDIRIKALSNANIPREVLSEALLDETNHEDITNILRRKVDYREDISVVALEWLTKNSSESSFLRAIATNPNITPDILTRLSVNESAEVRETVASQQKCPSEILATLAFDSAVEVKHKVAVNPNTPNYILESFAQSEDSAIRTAVASNPSLSPTTLEQLANDEKVEVRREVASNPNTPEIIRKNLQNLILPPNIQQTPTLQSLPRIYNPDTDELPTLLTEYAQSNNAFVRFVTLLHPITPEEILTQAANSASWLERYAVAENESTSLQIRQILALDGNRIVRAAANRDL